MFEVAGAVSKPVPATTESPTGTGPRIPSAMAYRIEEGWDLSARCLVPVRSLARDAAEKP